jgi:hypothetical protein
MSEDKKFTFDEDTLEAQREKAKDLIEGDKKAIEENAATARNPKIAPNQRHWAEARLKGNLEGKIRHEQQLSETEDRLKRLSNESQDGQ